MTLAPQGRSARRLGTLRALLLISALVASVFALPTLATPTAGWTTRLTFVRMSDGVDLAVRLYFPPGFRASGHAWPALFEMDGYGGAGTPDDATFVDRTRHYVLAYASVRGTGCSGGKFDLFSQRSARDGYDLIEHWLVRQPWSDGRVGITGHSYSGLTGMMVAELAPPHVRAIAVSGLIDDYYRGILYMGGVPNAGFPAMWVGAARQAEEFPGNVDNDTQNPECLANIRERGASDVAQPDVLAAAYTQQEATPSSWAIRHALINHIGGIRAPIQIGQMFQDSETGPRGGFPLWQAIPPSVPKRLILSNGNHMIQPPPLATKAPWLDCWVRFAGRNCGATADPRKRVVTFFETTASKLGAVATAADWPLPTTRWTRLYLHASGSLDPSPALSGSASYVSTSAGRQMTGSGGEVLDSNTNAGSATLIDGPDQLRWTHHFRRTTTINGPIDLTFWASSTAVDTDFFVDVLDRDRRTGVVRWLQKGLLRASLRRVDWSRSERVRSGPAAGTVYLPYHPYTGKQLLTPGQVYRYDVEIYPLGQVFRAGHDLILQLHAPAPSDPLSLDVWANDQPAAVNTVFMDKAHPSSLLLPIQPANPPVGRTPPPCAAVPNMPCSTPVK